MKIGYIDEFNVLHTLDVPDTATEQEVKELICEKFHVNPEDVEWDTYTGIELERN